MQLTRLKEKKMTLKRAMSKRVYVFITRAATAKRRQKEKK